jgi:hypothetical protein
VLAVIPSLDSWDALLHIAWLSDCGFLTVIAVSFVGIRNMYMVVPLI